MWNHPMDNDTKMLYCCEPNGGTMKKTADGRYVCEFPEDSKKGSPLVTLPEGNWDNTITEVPPPSGLVRAGGPARAGG